MFVLVSANGHAAMLLLNIAGDIAGKAVDMSYDHKPEDEVELARIKNAGGKVTMDGRVNGGLNLSRAIGNVDLLGHFGASFLGH